MSEDTSPAKPQPAVIDGVLYGMDAEIAVWVNERMGGGIVPTLFVGFGILKEQAPENFRKQDGQLDILAGCYFYNWQKENDVSDIHVCVAVDNIASAHPTTLRKVLDYPFGQLKVRRITAEIEMSNERSVRSAQKLGFQLEGRKRFMAAGGGDVGVFGLYPETCPLWKQEAA